MSIYGEIKWSFRVLILKIKCFSLKWVPIKINLNNKHDFDEVLEKIQLCLHIHRNTLIQMKYICFGVSSAGLWFDREKTTDINTVRKHLFFLFQKGAK